MIRARRHVAHGLIFTLAAGVTTASCVVGPKYVRPAEPVPAAYKEVSTDSSGVNWRPAQPRDNAVRERWWEVFNDSQLNALEEMLAIGNQNIAAAAANVQVARATLREAHSQYYPAVTASPTIMNSRVSTGFGQSIGNTFTTYALPVEASWEPDVWGRVRQAVSSTAFAAQAAVADLQSVRLAAHAELATEYCELRAQDALIAVLDSTVTAYQEALAITRDRFLAGLENDEAVAQAEAQLEIAQAQAASLHVLRAQYEHAIAVLVGEAPSTFAIAETTSAIDRPSVPVGLPSELLERRPDIASAERAVAQANAQIGVAQSAFFPLLSLTGTAGVESLSVSSWFTWPSRVWSVGPSAVQSIFDAGLRRATVQQFRASYDQAVANYRQTVLTSFQQVEDNLAAIRFLAQAITRQNAAIQSAQRSLDAAETRYTSGLDPYLNVIVAQTVLLNSRQAAVNYRSQELVASVQLIKALGGGWDVSRLPTPGSLAAGH